MAVLDQHGRPMMAKPEFTAASQSHKALKLWQPSLVDGDKSAREKPSIEARVLDVVRNNPFLAGAVRAQVDTIVGSRFRLALRPDWKALGVSRDASKAWVSQVESEWEAYAENPECWIDARREMTFSDMVRMIIMQDAMHGEAFIAKEWLTSPLGMKTCFQIVDPMRIKSTNSEAVHGIRRDPAGFATGYHVQSVQSGQNYTTTETVVPKYNRFGWQQFFHVFDALRPGQSRGISRIASALTTIKQLDRYTETELEMAILGASYALYVKSDRMDVDQMFGSGGLTPEFSTYLAAKKDQGAASKITNNGAHIPTLLPGEELGVVNIQHPTSSFDGFTTAVARSIARAIGSSYEQFTGDFSRTSYSSARASMIEAQRFVDAKRETVAGRFATTAFRIWMDEAVDKGRVNPPIDYWANRSALTRCSWISAGKSHIDELKTAKARQVALQTGTITLQDIASEDGRDWEEVFEQRMLEAERMVDAMEQMGISVTEADKTRIIFGQMTGRPVEAALLEDESDGE